MISIGVIGYGYWGPNLVRNFAEGLNTNVVAVSDLNRDRLQLASRRYPAIHAVSDYRDVLRNPNIDAVAISTPVSTHYQLALEALQAGKHVLVEKPITADSQQAAHLIDEAARRNLVLMVDHTFVYTGAVRKIRELITKDVLGEVYYYDSTRVNLGLFQHDINVIWDLAVHDLSILDYILGEQPREVSATGVAHVNGAEDTAYVSLFYDGSVIAHLNLNWLSPVKVRRALIGGTRSMIVYDDLEASEKIRIYDKGIVVSDNPESIYKVRVNYRSGDMHAPRLDMTEALAIEIEHFVDCIENNKTPVTDGHAGLRVVSILEAATRSMKERGRSIGVESWSPAQVAFA
jgi:predicted dehydrogenase